MSAGLCGFGLLYRRRVEILWNQFDRSRGLVLEGKDPGPVHV